MWSPSLLPSVLDFPNVVEFRGVQNTSGIQIISIPNASYVASFYSLPDLRTLYAPKLTHIGLTNCPLLSSVTFDNVVYIYFCISLGTLPRVVLPKCQTYSGAGFFGGCRSLSQIYLLNSSVVNWSYTGSVNLETLDNPLVDESLLGYYASIYVPSSLYSAYISHNRWSVFSERFVPIDMGEESHD